MLEPCGRRIDVHALRGKKLAVDASVWIFRFLKAMRDDRGDPLPNAHLIGFLRRICKLLYLNVWPVFVFDGSTPALKRKTVHERRKRREQQQARVKRTAEKLLLNRLKQYAVSQVKEKGLLGEDGGGRNREGEADGTQGLPRRPQPVFLGPSRGHSRRAAEERCQWYGPHCLGDHVGDHTAYPWLGARAPRCLAGEVRRARAHLGVEFPVHEGRA